jgi:osmotically-inducible protein OsmY
MRFTTTLLAAALALTLGGAPAHADTKDAWVKTKAKIALLTTDGVSVTDVNVDVSNGAVTLHGKVKTDAEKRKAEETIQKIDGVRSVRNLLQVVPENVEQAVKVSDDMIEDHVENSLKAVKTLDDVDVKSVSNGVVLLSGHVNSLDDKLRAIEVAWTVSGVRRVASEIQTGDD